MVPLYQAESITLWSLPRTSKRMPCAYSRITESLRGLLALSLKKVPVEFSSTMMYEPPMKFIDPPRSLRTKMPDWNSTLQSRNQ